MSFHGRVVCNKIVGAWYLLNPKMQFHYNLTFKFYFVIDIRLLKVDVRVSFQILRDFAGPTMFCLIGEKWMSGP